MKFLNLNSFEGFTNICLILFFVLLVAIGLILCFYPMSTGLLILLLLFASCFFVSFCCKMVLLMDGYDPKTKNEREEREERLEILERLFPLAQKAAENDRNAADTNRK